MTFGIFIPPSALGPNGVSVPLLYFLSGLTCTDANFSEKSGAFSHAAKAQIAIVMPDTSPRGVEGVPTSETTSWDFGFGAGFYVDATQEPWSRHWRMESYVMCDLPAAIAGEPSLATLLDLTRVAISGHSMGGYGALTLALKHPTAFRSVSAFAPIAHPSKSPWGRKAFTGYLGADEAAWAAHDPTSLVSTDAGAAAAAALHIKIDVGGSDEWGLKGYLLEADFCVAAAKHDAHIDFQMHEGYDHGYFFVSTFIASHINHHAKHLYNLPEKAAPAVRSPTSLRSL